jgi:hypothetical protein
LGVTLVALLADEQGVEIAFLAVIVVAGEEALLPGDNVDNVFLLALPAFEIAHIETDQSAVGIICNITCS